MLDALEELNYLNRQEKALNMINEGQRLAKKHRYRDKVDYKIDFRKLNNDTICMWN